jgi:amino acid adenylation domain-containing protein
MPAALLGILKAGAAYVPLDAGWPASRSAWILARLGIRHLVTEGPRLSVLASALEETEVADVVRLDRSGPVDLPERIRVWEPLDGTHGLNGLRAGADDLAYIIFTSGTTGTPKGVMLRHRPVVNLIEWANRRFAVGPGDRVLFLTSLCFDLSVYDIFGILAAGGSIRVASDDEVRDPQALVRILLGEPVSFWDSAPAALQQLVPFLPEGPEAGSGHLRLAFLSGDWIPVALPDRLRRAFPAVRPIALGGATEAAIWSNSYPVGTVDPTWPSIPYGRPIQNARYHVLDELLAPCPVRVAGDLYIGGDCLSAGYWGEPELTAQKYLPDPFSGNPGDRLYRTGDRARHWPDGTLEFLGRLDHQVKIRGFRVELGEIEAVLGRHPAVREAAVLAPLGADGHRLLVAYVAARSADCRPSADELREHLARQLPEPMIPSAFVFLDALPVTPNGKLDRKALPALDLQTEEDGRQPRTPLEELIAGLFAEILGLPSVGVDQSFFDLAGHSLLAAQLTARLTPALGIEVPLRRLFEQPTVAGLAASLMEGDMEDGVPAPPPLVPVQREPEDPPPLSFAQERLWFLDQIQPGDPTYNVAAGARLLGRLDLPALAGALDEIARRHEALRTSFAIFTGRPVQVVAPSLSLAPPAVDLSALPPAVRQRETVQQMREAGARPFDLARGPLVRALILRLGGGEHAVLLTLHHTVSDAWSMGVMMQELATLYAAFSLRRPSPLPCLPIQYADFAAWQRWWLTGEVLERQISWWRERLAGAPARLDLPSDRPRPAVQTFHGARLAWHLPPSESAALERLGRQQSATPFMVLLGAFAAVLSRSSGQETIVVGAPHANRSRIETESLIGDFANTLALRLDLGDDPAGGALLARAREATLGAHAHQDLPFEKLVEELRPERSLAHSPIFQVMLNLQNTPVRRFELPGLTLETLAVEGITAKYELTLELTPGADGLTGVWEHNTGLFDEVTVRRLAGHFQTLLAGLVASPELPVSELPLLSLPERAELTAWNATAVPYDLSRPLHAWIEEAAARAPGATAVEGDAESLTWRELLDRSGRLAHHLRGLGIGRDALVGVAAERSPEMVVGLLAVLRAGAAYVPLDPDYPAERLAFMLEDSGVRVLLTQERLRAVLPASAAAITIVPLDAGADWENGPAPARLDDEIDAASAAYMIYTSGSTGRPKGAVNTHRGIVNRLLWMQETFALTPADRVLQKTPVSFDVSVWELFWPLLTGARLVLARPGGHQDPAYLVRRIQSTGVTVLHFVPSMLPLFLDEPGAAACASLRLVMASGEALSGALARRFREIFPESGEESGAALHNLYGPTEAAVDVTWWPARAESGERPVPIGRPVANTRIVLCDRHGREVPAGVAGELCIGGVQLARGYWRRPELTAERFVPDGCGGVPGERLYRTGDLARRLPDGAIEYSGRLDNQVKLRGFRIELGEVEAALGACPEVREAVVGARGQGTSLRLVAWVTPEPGRELAVAALRSALRRSLPEFMVPSAIVVLPALPLSPNGKVDRKTLPDPEGAPARRPGEPGEPPANALERRIASLWSAVLGIERVGRSDNFFDLGGHSLLLVELRSRLREQLGQEVSMLDLFRHTTVKGLAEHLGGGATSAVPARSPERREEIQGGKERLRQRLGRRRS